MAASRAQTTSDIPDDISELDRPGDLAPPPDGGETGGFAATGFEDAATDIAAADASSDISVSADCVTEINVFTVAPDQQARLIELLERATDEVVRQQPGFISANLHAGVDGTRVTNYAQWASVEDLQAMLASPDCRPHLDQCDAIAESDSHVYRVASVHHR